MRLVSLSIVVLAVSLAALGLASANKSVMAAGIFHHRTPGGVCQVGSLAAPGDPGYGPYSADYYSPQFSYGLHQRIHVIFAAYTVLNDSAPRPVSLQVLDSAFSPVGDYSLVATGCQQNNDVASTSMFTYDATWITPPTPNGQGVYYLAVSFAYADGTLVEYFANIRVRVPPLVMTGGSIHWETTLSGIGYQQSSAAYDLFSPGTSNIVTARTSFYFDANPAAVCAGPPCVPGSASTTYIQGGMANSLEGGNIFVLATSPQVPFYRAGWGRQTRHFTFTQNLGGTLLSDTGTISIARGLYTIGQHAYRYHVEIDEPFSLRSGGTTLVHVGSYVIDNGITGPVGWQGNADNLGEGQGVRFYVNPALPHASTTAITTTARAATVTLSGYDVASTGAVEPPNGATMAWQYVIHLYQAACSSLTNLAGCTSGAEVAGSPHRTAAATDTWTNLAAGEESPGNCYWAQVQALFTVKGVLHLTSDVVPAIVDPRAVFCLYQAAAPTTQTPTAVPTTTPPATATNTPTPTFPPSTTATPTLMPLTATPTPARGTATLVQTVVPYAWVRTAHAEDAAAADRLYASTWGNNPDPSTFYWPLGRPLHLLPAVGENPSEARLAIDDLGNGGRAMLYAQSVAATSYTLLDAGALGESHCIPTGSAAQPHSYFHDRHYPAAVDPFSPRLALVWAPADLAGPLPPTTLRCDAMALLNGSAAGPMTLTYRVNEVVTFMARFAAVAPIAGGGTDCADQLAPLRAASPFSAEPGVPPPAPAVTAAQAPTGPCKATTVGLAAALQALAHWPSEVTVADPGGHLTNVAYTATGTVVRITMTVERMLTLRFHLLVSREVTP